MNGPGGVLEFKTALIESGAVYGLALEPTHIDKFIRFYELLLKWNDRLHLVAPCGPKEFAEKHILESLLAVPHLTEKRVTDIGSGGGLPIIPCLILSPHLQATMIESSAKKGVFLNEAVRLFQFNGTVITERFENVEPPENGIVTCRALERFTDQLPRIIDWARHSSRFLFFGGESLKDVIEKTSLSFTQQKMPNSERRFLYVIER
jgi:16S rRNA (guanine527-N7)-methyltransferase